jgi:hypothetical protein
MTMIGTELSFEHSKSIEVRGVNAQTSQSSSVSVAESRYSWAQSSTGVKSIFGYIFEYRDARASVMVQLQAIQLPYMFFPVL